MTILYTLEYVQKSKEELKRVMRRIKIMIIILLISGVFFVFFRNPSRHVLSIIVLSTIWTCGIWFAMMQIFINLIPLKRDVSFAEKMINNAKKEVKGMLDDCEEEITIQRIPCYIMKIQTGQSDKKGMKEMYLDRRFRSDEMVKGKQICLQVTNHFVCGYEIGGIGSESE